MSINVYIVRHGQTILNLYHRMQGWADAPLTESGRQDGVTAGKALVGVHFDYAFASDLPRAMKTAQLALDQLPAAGRPQLQVNTNFREQSMGFLEGEDGGHAAEILTGKPYHSFMDFLKDYTVKEARDMMSAQDPHHIAENDREFTSRIEKGIQQLSELPDGSNVLLVSHGLVIRTIMEEYGADIYDPAHAPQNGSIQLMAITDGQPRIKYYNRYTLPTD